MNYNNYRTQKAANNITLQKVGPNFVSIKKKFDGDSGVEITPEMTQFRRDDIEKQIAGHETALAELSALLADLDALPVK